MCFFSQALWPKLAAAVGRVNAWAALQSTGNQRKTSSAPPSPLLMCKVNTDWWNSSRQKLLLYQSAQLLHSCRTPAGKTHWCHSPTLTHSLTRPGNLLQLPPAWVFCVIKIYNPLMTRLEKALMTSKIIQFLSFCLSAVIPVLFYFL